MKKFLLIDSDILIDVARGDSKAIERLIQEEEKYSLAISSVTQMELIVGCQNKSELKNLNVFINKFEIFSINEEINLKSVELLSEYRLSHGLLIADSFIASTAIVLNIPLLSKNQKHYKFLKDLILFKY